MTHRIVYSVTKSNWEKENNAVGAGGEEGKFIEGVRELLETIARGNGN